MISDAQPLVLDLTQPPPAACAAASSASSAPAPVVELDAAGQLAQPSQKAPSSSSSSNKPAGAYDDEEVGTVLKRLGSIFPTKRKEELSQIVQSQAAAFKRDGGKVNVAEAIDLCATIVLSDGLADAAPQDETKDEVQIVDDGKSPLQIVMEVFPDACPDFVVGLLGEHDGDSQVVIQLMAEKSYKKRAKSAITSSSSTSLAERYNFKDSAWETSADYQLQALAQLMRDFSFLYKDSVKSVLLQHNGHYFHARQALEELTGCAPGCPPANLSEWSRENQDRLVAARIKVKKTNGKAAQQPEMELSDEVLLAEMEWIRVEKRKRQQDADEELAKRLNQEEAEATGALFECGCCYSEYPFEDLVQCSEGHLFCQTCLQRYAENTLFGTGRTQLRCMNGSEPCTGRFTEDQLQRALSEKVYRKYVEAEALDATKAANLDNLVQCHHCGLQVELAPELKVLDCPGCQKSTCRECNEEAHIPLRCEEVEKKAQTNARLRIEEAMSQARIRECPNPKCKTRFYKVEGCNKMTCACGTLLCYICRKDITKTGYNHFCRLPHCDHKSCGNCVLFTNTEEDDRLAMRDAGIKAIEEVKATENGDAELPQVDIDKLLEGGAKNLLKRPRVDNPPQFNAFQPLQNLANQALQGFQQAFGGAPFGGFGQAMPAYIAPVPPRRRGRRGRRRRY